MATRLMNFGRDYGDLFAVARQSVADKARCYLAGLLMKGDRKNMEVMAEHVEDYDYQSQQQFLSDSPWDAGAVMDRVGLGVSSVIGGSGSALAIDESGFSKKGKKSVGVARQWNGRLGKVDSAQVGVFAALCDGRGGALVDSRLYLPREWTDDPARCIAAKVPEEALEYRSKTEIALDLIKQAVANKLKFGHVAFDALYGSTPWLLNAVDDMGLVFVGDVRTNVRVYAEDPKPFLPRRKGGKGAKFTKRRACTEPVEILNLFVEDPEVCWESVVVRESTRGELRVTASRKRVWMWDGEQKAGWCLWAACVHDEESGDTKFFLSNADENATLEGLVRMHALRFWVERVFQDAKGSLGMADYQARGWVSWHHHMALVAMANLFLLYEKRVHLVEVDLLSAADIVELLAVILPRRDRTLPEVVANMERRHRKRAAVIAAAKGKQKARDSTPESVLTK